MIKKIFNFTVPIVFFFLSLEVFSFGYYTFIFKKLQKPLDIKHVIYGQGWLPTQKKTYCDFGSRFWGPHPYLGYNRTSVGNEECNLDGVVNNQNMSGADYPNEKTIDDFVLMVTGGSVAEGMSIYWDKEIGERYFEYYLNSKFYPPKGKKFKVISGALGDYRHPQSLIVANLHHDIIDGIVDLSGYNEALIYVWGGKLETPSYIYWEQLGMINQRKISSEVRNAILWFEKSLCRYSYSCLFAINSFVDRKISQKQEDLGFLKGFQTTQSYPREWTEEKIWSHRLNKHKGYYRLINGMCKTMDFYCAFFIQPIPQIEKTLTSDEIVFAQKNSAMLKPVYEKLNKSLLQLQNENMPIYSLVSIFKNEKDQIYSDEIHSNFNDKISKGNRIYAEAITENLGKRWNLKPKITNLKKLTLGR